MLINKLTIAMHYVINPIENLTLRNSKDLKSYIQSLEVVRENMEVVHSIRR